MGRKKTVTNKLATSKKKKKKNYFILEFIKFILKDYFIKKNKYKIFLNFWS
jgi:hypothetical protein